MPERRTTDVTNSKIAGRFVFDATLRSHGGAPFASKMGGPAKDHFASMTSRPEDLHELSRTPPREGAQPLRSEFA
jgi:hypothetical protein